MTTKLLALVHSKVALAVLGVLLVGGSGAAVVAANHGQNPSTQASAQATHTPAADSGNHGHTVSLEGKLTAYHASAKTISVQTKDANSPTTVSVAASTRVNGEHASTLSDLTNAVGHDVQVQATKQSDGSLLARKITVQGSDSSHDDGNDSNNGNAAGQQHTLTGTIASTGTGSFVLTLPDGTTKTVTVSASTAFKGTAHRFADLMRGMHVAVTGADQANGNFAATQVASGSASGSGS